MRTIHTTQTDEPMAQALCLGTSVPRHKPQKKLGNEANPFSLQAIPFLPLSLTRHAAKQTASYLNSAVETAGDAKKYTQKTGIYSPFVCPWVIVCAMYLSVPGSSVTLAICPGVVNR